MFCSRISVFSLMAAATILLNPLADAAVAQGAQSAPTSPADQRLADLSQRAVDTWLVLNPVFATQVGSHKYDTEIDDFTPAGRKKIADAEGKLLGELNAIDVSKLTRENQIDAAILRNQLESDIWSIDTLQDWKWDPQVYNNIAGGAIYNVMAREFAPVSDRLKSATARMKKIPQIFAQMRVNLDPTRVPKVDAETVAKQHAGILSLIDTFITPNADQLQGADRRALDDAVTSLRKAVAEQQTWLDKTLVPNAKGDFRLGQKLYDAKLHFALNSALSRDEIKRRAESELVRVRARMYDVSKSVLQGKPNAPALPANPTPQQQQTAIEAALELAYADRPPRDKVVDFAKSALDQATVFTRQHDLVTVPSDPVKVILMPEFQRGVAVAYCDSPGPLDKGLATYFAISPIPDEWSQEQVDSFLREYNSRMIHLLAIHEAMPGHYLEGVHSANSHSVLRSVLRSGLFAEGWAVYTENLMADQGYLNNDPLFRLVQQKFYLRAVANAILDIGVHVEGWTREQAMELMTKKTFQQEREAAGKWVRVQLTSAQLPTYFVGVQEHFDMRKAVEAKQGANFNLKAYHDQVLSYGAPPVRFVREMMLGEPIE